MTDETDIFNAADPEAVTRRRRRADRSESRRLAAFSAVMATPDGRRYLWWLLERCGVFKSSFTGDHATFFNEGQRNVGLAVMADIHAACPELYAVMLHEAQEETHG